MQLKTCHALKESSFGLQISIDTSSTIEDFFSKFRSVKYDCLLLDIMIDNAELDGIAVLQKVRKEGFTGPVIMLTTLAETRTIALCVEAGATDFVTKGATEVELAFRITRAIKNAQKDSASQIYEDFYTGETLRHVRLKLKRVLNSSLRSVLVYGESGTGKEGVGKLVQSLLGNDRPFVSVNCGAIPEELIESEFFGHRKGAFTGASLSKEGYFSQAHGGWLFLDEIGNLSFGAQAALLRVLESGEMRQVGGTASQIVDVRILAATNVDLDEKVAKSEFRGDLLQRLRTYEIYLPPLRERSRIEQEEILDHLLERLNRSVPSSPDDDPIPPRKYSLTSETRKLMLGYKWERGNIREMWNTLQAASIDALDGLITVVNMPKFIRKALLEQDAPLGTTAASAATEEAAAFNTAAASHSMHASNEAIDALTRLFPKLSRSLQEDVSLEDVLDEVERVVIDAALKRHDNRSGAYQGLQISRSSLNQKKQKFGL
jgi:DNA-binding NtrC family response regulator